MRPSSRLDLLLAPSEPTAPPELALIRSLVVDGVLHPDGTPGPSAHALVPFRRWRLEEPGGLTLWANRQGGFSVTCPSCGANVVRTFSAAWTDGRRNPSPPQHTCPTCGAVGPLHTLTFRPAAAFAHWALVLAEVEHSALSAGAERRWPELARMVIVLRRG